LKSKGVKNRPKSAVERPVKSVLNKYKEHPQRVEEDSEHFISIIKSLQIDNLDYKDFNNNNKNNLVKCDNLVNSDNNNNINNSNNNNKNNSNYNKNNSNNNNNNNIKPQLNIKLNRPRTSVNHAVNKMIMVEIEQKPIEQSKFKTSNSYQSLLSFRSNKKDSKSNSKIRNITSANKKREKRLNEDNINIEPLRDNNIIKPNTVICNPIKKMRTNFDIFKEIYMNENNNYKIEKKINS